MDQRKLRGDLAEKIAAEYLDEKGYRILEKNWRCRFGEIDIVAESEAGVLVFVEVRSRYSVNFGEAIESVDHRKRQKVRSIANFYLAGLPTTGRGHKPMRCDAVIVKWLRPPDEFELIHIENAF